MTHFAKVVDNIVVDVIVAEQDFIDSYTDRVNDGSKWIQTSYNTSGGKHLEEGKEPLRYNYAGIGFTYDKDNDAFISQQPYPSFILNTETYRWTPPIPYPTGFDGGLRRFIWDEEHYNQHSTWRDLWQNELSYFNPEHRFYDPTIPRDFSDIPWEW